MSSVSCRVLDPSCKLDRHVGIIIDPLTGPRRILLSVDSPISDVAGDMDPGPRLIQHTAIYGYAAASRYGLLLLACAVIPILGWTE